VEEWKKRTTRERAHERAQKGGQGGEEVELVKLYAPHLIPSTKLETHGRYWGGTTAKDGKWNWERGKGSWVEGGGGG
jgi:hypothetical protein